MFQICNLNLYKSLFPKDIMGFTAIQLKLMPNSPTSDLKAIEKKAICHFWFHPSLDKSIMSDYFFKILDYICDRREIGDLKILTLKDIVNII